MSAAVGAVSATKGVPFNAHLEDDHKNNNVGGEPDQLPYDDTAEETEAEEDSKLELDLGPQFSIKEQFDKDKVSFFLLCSYFHFLSLHLFFDEKAIW